MKEEKAKQQAPISKRKLAASCALILALFFSGSGYTETPPDSLETTSTRVIYYITDDYAEVWENGERVEIIKHYRINGQKVATRDKEGLKFNYSDHLGSAGQLADKQGNQIKALWYTPYGSTAFQTGDVKVPYKYNDKEQDDTGMYYYVARYQDPDVGRFMSADTILPNAYDSQQLNRFSYVRNNPVKLVDPSGHAPEESDKEKSSVEEIHILHINFGIDKSVPEYAYPLVMALADLEIDGLKASLDHTCKSYGTGCGVQVEAHWDLDRTKLNDLSDDASSQERMWAIETSYAGPTVLLGRLGPLSGNKYDHLGKMTYSMFSFNPDGTTRSTESFSQIPSWGIILAPLYHFLSFGKTSILAHEMGHAARYEGDSKYGNHSKDPFNSMWEHGVFFGQTPDAQYGKKIAATAAVFSHMNER